MKANDGRYQLFTFRGDSGKINEGELFLKEAIAEPMLVMTVPGADKPITGDYDLFAVCPSWANYGSMFRAFTTMRSLDGPSRPEQKMVFP